MDSKEMFKYLRDSNAPQGVFDCIKGLNSKIAELESQNKELMGLRKCPRDTKKIAELEAQLITAHTENSQLKDKIAKQGIHFAHISATKSEAQAIRDMVSVLAREYDDDALWYDVRCYADKLEEER